MNLEADLRDILLREMGPGSTDCKEMARLTTVDLLAAYANWAIRFPEPKPRTVHRSRQLDRFLRRSGSLAADARTVIREIERGDDLELRLSSQVKFSWVPPDARYGLKLRRLDRFLYAWGIHHLHLGARGGDGVRVRSSQLLFVAFVEDQAFAIAVKPHRTWDTDVLLRITAENWPDGGPLLGSNQSMELGTAQPEQDRAALRAANTSTFFPHRGRIYMGRDQLSVGGTSLNAATWAAQQYEAVRRAAEAIASNETQVVDQLERRQPTMGFSRPVWSIDVENRCFVLKDSASGRFLALDDVPTPT